MDNQEFEYEDRK